MKTFFKEDFLQKFAFTISCLTFLYDFQFFYIDFPEKNRDIINMVSGVLNTVCLVTIITYFYGSSKGSKDKQEILNQKNEPTV